MALPYSYIGAGTYTNPATPVALNIPLTDSPDWFFVRNITVSPGGWGGNDGTNYTAIANISSEWFSGMAQGSFLQTGQAASLLAAATLYPTQGTAGGFTFVDPTNPPVFAGLVSTTINHTTLVVTMANTGSIAVGDIVRVINPVAMLEIGGLVAQVTAVTVNTSITLGYVATAVSAGLNLVANGTSSTIVKIIPQLYYPRARQVMYITQATQAKVYFAQKNDFTIGEIVDFSIPAQYGMTQVNYLTGAPGGAPTVLAVTNSATESSITINLNTSGFTAFQYPTSANIQTGGGSPPVCVPAGSGVVPNQSPPGTNLLDAFDNRNQYYMNLGTNVVGPASSTIQWVAMKADYGNLSNA